MSLSEDILKHLPISILKEQMNLRKIPWKDVYIKKRGQKRKKFGTQSKTPYIKAIVDYDRKNSKKNNKKNNKKNTKNNPKNANKNKKKGNSKSKTNRNVNINEPPMSDSLAAKQRGSPSKSSSIDYSMDRTNNHNKNIKKKHRYSLSDGDEDEDDTIDAMLEQDFRNDDDEDKLLSLQSDLKEHFGRVILMNKDIKQLRKQKLNRRNVEKLVKNSDARLTLELGIIMDIEDFLNDDVAKRGKGKNGDKAESKDDDGLVRFKVDKDTLEANFEDFLRYIYDKKYKDIYVVHPKKQQAAGGLFVQISSKIFYDNNMWHHIWLELIFTLKLWLQKKTQNKSILGEHCYTSILKGSSTWSKRKWHFRGIFVNPTGYVGIMLNEYVKDKNKWFDIGTPFVKKMLVEILYEHESNLKGYEFVWTEKFVKDFQLMLGDVWTSIRRIDLDEITEEVNEIVNGKNKKEENNNNNDNQSA